MRWFRKGSFFPFVHEPFGTAQSKNPTCILLPIIDVSQIYDLWWFMIFRCLPEVTDNIHLRRDRILSAYWAASAVGIEFWKVPISTVHSLNASLFCLCLTIKIEAEPPASWNYLESRSKQIPTFQHHPTSFQQGGACVEHPRLKHAALQGHSEVEQKFPVSVFDTIDANYLRGSSEKDVWKKSAWRGRVSLRCDFHQPPKFSAKKTCESFWYFKTYFEFLSKTGHISLGERPDIPFFVVMETPIPASHEAVIWAVF